MMDGAALIDQGNRVPEGGAPAGLVLRAIDIADPLNPKEVGYYIPGPARDFAAPQSNDVYVDDRGLIYLIDRIEGLDILELT